MPILPSVTAPELVDRFLEHTRGLSHVAAARLWGVNPSYIRQLRRGKRPQRLHTAHRSALVTAVEQLEREATRARTPQRRARTADGPIASRVKAAERQLAELSRDMVALIAQQDRLARELAR
ncbi:MAG: hypothetical protein HY084_04205 [Gemmatimonadetes bacterium]|nr:hypothetical protein [Gemmatimonadota bacterium]